MVNLNCQVHKILDFRFVVGDRLTKEIVSSISFKLSFFVDTLYQASPDSTNILCPICCNIGLLNKLYIVQCASMSMACCAPTHPRLLISTKQLAHKTELGRSGRGWGWTKTGGKGWTLRVKQSNKGDHCPGFHTY